MKIQSIAPVTAGLLLVTTALAQESAAPTDDKKLESQQDRISYSIGVNIGQNLRGQSIELNGELIAAGLVDSLEDKDLQLSQAEMQEAFMAFQKQMQQKQGNQSGAQAEANLQKSKEFLAQNNQKPDVKATSSGLQYKVLEEGSGPKPEADDTVTVHYKGTLIDGSTFDSSYERGQPATFPVQGVIPGWTEALQMMKVGGKWKLFIPPQLAYGEQAPQSIGPNQALIFEVELRGINEEQ